MVQEDTTHKVTRLRTNALRITLSRYISNAKALIYREISRAFRAPTAYATLHHKHRTIAPLFSNNIVNRFNHLSRLLSDEVCHTTDRASYLTAFNRHHYHRMLVARSWSGSSFVCHNARSPTQWIAVFALFGMALKHQPNMQMPDHCSVRLL